jgi:hypothetical protein
MSNEAGQVGFGSAARQYPREATSREQLPVRSDRMTVRVLSFWWAIGLLLCSTDCRKPSPGKSEGDVATGSQSVSWTIEDALCRGANGCAIQRQRPVEKDMVLVDVGFSIAGDAGDDECTKREYWLVDTGGHTQTLLAEDCQEQRSAESPSAAETRLEAGRLVFRYVEFQASDACEEVEASIDLGNLSVQQIRYEGVSDSKGCGAKKRVNRTVPPGNGARGYPILRLHLEWVDEHPEAAKR